MFDFVASQNQKWQPTKRIYASWFLSCIIHLIVIILLIENPQWLQGGEYHRFRIPLISGLLTPTPDAEDKNWRTLTFVKTGPMTAPSEATLKEYLSDRNKKAPGDSAPPVKISLGADLQKAIKESPLPAPTIKQEPQPAEPLPQAKDVGATASAPGSSSTALTVGDADSGRKTAVSLPPIKDVKPKTEIAANSTPMIIPSGKPEPIAPSSQKIQSAQEKPSSDLNDQQKAIRSEGSGLFGTKGFPLDEYVDRIKDMIDRNWFIPSNLRNKQGNTTVIFYIEKDGHYSDARIVKGSGINSLDIAALNAILDSKFPPLPKGFPGEHIGAKFIFSYNESQ